MSKNRLGTKTLFVNNTVSQTSNIFNSSNVLVNPILKRIMIELIYYSNLYSIGDLESLTNEFTLQLYTRYSKILYGLKQGGKGEEEIIRQNTLKLMVTIYTNISVYQDYQIITQNNISLKNEVAILHDTEKLNAYIHTLRNSANTYLFGEHNVSISSVHVNKEYIEYIKTYGYPINGVFDPDLLGYFAQRV
tara:strand:- start:2004 stop:2576 length:573 start_codon:yes stop_codon:yes gene_type:complete